MKNHHGGTETQRRSEASEYWRGNIDPQNLERGKKTPPRITLEDEIAFAEIPDVQAGLIWLAGEQPETDPAERTVLDLGAGLGAISFYFARKGWRVIAVDSSPERLRELRRRAKEAGCADSIRCVAGAAEALPFKSESLPAIFTKSVLIHTELPAAAREIERVLSPDGRAALVEPQTANPFARLYRNTLGPKSWKAITRYFDNEAQNICIGEIGSGEVRPFYLFSFFAFVFQFGWPNLKLFRTTLKLLQPFDRMIFRLIPPMKKAAWFGLIVAKVAKKGTSKD